MRIGIRLKAEEKLLADGPQHEQRPPVRTLRELRLVRVLHGQPVEGGLLDGAQPLVAEHFVWGKRCGGGLREHLSVVLPATADDLVGVSGCWCAALGTHSE